MKIKMFKAHMVLGANIYKRYLRIWERICKVLTISSAALSQYVAISSDYWY
jgi:hypothetical protein